MKNLKAWLIGLFLASITAVVGTVTNQCTSSPTGGINIIQIELFAPSEGLAKTEFVRWQSALGSDWTEKGISGLRWDCGFIAAYVCLGCFLLLRARESFNKWLSKPSPFVNGYRIPNRLLKFGHSLVWAMIVAGILDYLENFCIYRMLLATADDIGSAHLGWLPFWCSAFSWPKWIILTLAFGYWLVATILWLGESLEKCTRWVHRQNKRPKWLRWLLSLMPGWISMVLESILYLIFGLPPRPDDWISRGWDGQDKESSDRYGQWFTSGTRFVFQMIYQRPGLLLVTFSLFAMVCGWGTKAFGIPYLFIDPDDASASLLSGVGVGLLLGDICYVGCVLASREWMKWWTASNLILTQRKIGEGRIISTYLRGTLWFFCPLLWIASIISTSDGIRSTSAWIFNAGTMIGAYILWVLVRAISKWTVPTNGPRASALAKVKTMRQFAVDQNGAGAATRRDVFGLHAGALVTMAVFTPLLTIGFFFPNAFSWLRTSMLLCLALGTIAGIYGWIAFHGLLNRMILVPTIAMGALLALNAVRSGGSPVYTHTYQDVALAALYDHPKTVSLSTEQDGSDIGISSEKALENWASLFEKASDGTKPRLVIICTAGGGIMASAWTTAVFTELEETIPGFSKHVRLVTGSSGGMVGAVHCVSALAGDLEHKERKSVATFSDPIGLYNCVTGDSLNNSVKWMVLRDLPNLALRPLWNIVNWNPHDRGEALQGKWEQLAEGRQWRITRSFGELRKFEEEGRIPSLMISPSSVEDGRQFVISNLDIRNMEGVDVNGDGPGSIESRSIISMRGLLPGVVDSMKIATAARMTSTFPFVSPASELPTDPPLRVVDSGYTENYGVKLACLWIAQNHQALSKHTSGVVVVQLRAGLTTAQTRDYRDLRQGSRWHVASGIASPLTAIGNALSLTNILANDERLYLLRHFQQSTGLQVRVVTFDCPYEASLTWHLTEKEKTDLKRALRTKHAAEVKWDSDPAVSELITKLENPQPFYDGKPVLPDLSDPVTNPENANQALREQSAKNNYRELLNLKLFLRAGESRQL